MRIVCIGAGAAGLATAGLLAKSGHSVHVIDKLPEYGGRAGSLTFNSPAISTSEEKGQQSYRFDTGPSWYLMPDAFDHFFELMGTSTAEELKLERLDPAYRIFPEEFDPVDVPCGRHHVEQLFESIEPGAGKAVGEYLDSAALSYRLAVQYFLYTTFSSLNCFVNKDVLTRLGLLTTLLTRSLESFAGDKFKDIRLKQILTYPAVFLSSRPADTPALYHLMSHTDLDQGVFYPQGGFTAVMDALYKVAVGGGATFEYNCEALAIEVDEKKRPWDRLGAVLRPARRVWARFPGTGKLQPDNAASVTGVTVRRSDGSVTTIPADVVVSCADLKHTETALLPSHLQTFPESHFAHGNPGPSVVLLYLGVEGKIPTLAHHSLVLSADWEQDFRVVFDQTGEGSDGLPWSSSIYISCPSKTDETVAPAGQENLFVLVPVPADTSIGHGSAYADGVRRGSPTVEAIADRAIELIAQRCKIPDLAERISVRKTVGPADFAGRYNAWSGGAIGPAHTLFQSAFFRGTNRSAFVTGLYYAGGTTLPGVGIPMCLISAENVVKRLEGDVSTTPRQKLIT